MAIADPIYPHFDDEDFIDYEFDYKCNNMFWRDLKAYEVVYVNGQKYRCHHDYWDGDFMDPFGQTMILHLVGDGHTHNIQVRFRRWERTYSVTEDLGDFPLRCGGATDLWQIGKCIDR